MTRLPRRSRLEPIDLSAPRLSNVYSAFDSSLEPAHPALSRSWPSWSSRARTWAAGGTLTPRSPDTGTIAPVSPEPSAEPSAPPPSEPPAESEAPTTPEPIEPPIRCHVGEDLPVHGRKARPGPARGRRHPRRRTGRAERPLRRPDRRGGCRVPGPHHGRPGGHDPARPRYRRRPGHGRPVARVRVASRPRVRCSGGWPRSSTR